MNHRGFTLIEILIALTVFAIISVITATLMNQAFDTKKRVGAQADALNTISFALTLINRDIAQATLRPIHGDDMHEFPAFTGLPQYLEFTRNSVANPHSKALRSTLKRIAYLCTNHQFIKRTWPVLDIPQRNQYHDKILLTDITSCQFAYMNHAKQILPEWREHAVQQNQKSESLPMAVQFKLTIPHWGSSVWLFSIPESVYGE